MFYLKEVLKIYKKNFTATMFFNFVSVSLLVLLINFGFLQNQINHYLPKIENEHYFDALVSSKINTEMLTRKILELPGVLKIDALKQSEVKNEINKINNELNLTKDEISELSSMTALKVSMTPELNQSSINLIREYMQRITGADNIVLGSVSKKINQELEVKNVLNIIKSWPLQVAGVVLVLFWILSFFNVRFEVKRVAYIIESFQRKNLVAFKIMATMISIVLTVSILLSYIILSPNLYSLLLISSFSFFIPYALCGKKVWVKS